MSAAPSEPTQLYLIDSMAFFREEARLRAEVRRQTHPGDVWVKEHAGIEPGVRALGAVLEAIAHAVSHGAIDGPHPKDGSVVRVSGATIQRAIPVGVTLKMGLSMRPHDLGLLTHWDSKANTHRHSKGEAYLGGLMPTLQRPTLKQVRWFDSSTKRLGQSVILNRTGLELTDTIPPRAVSEVTVPHHLPWLLVDETRHPPYGCPLWLIEAMGQAANLPFAEVNNLDPALDVLLGQRIRTIWLRPNLPAGQTLTLVTNYHLPFLGRWRLRADVSAWLGDELVGLAERLVCLQVPLDALER